MTAAVLGWVGTIGTLMAYLMANRGRLSIKSRRYAMVNAVGGVLSGTASALYGAWPSAAANFAWALVGAHALLIGVARGPSPFTAARSLARSRGSRRRMGTSNSSRQPRHVRIVANHASAMPAAPRCTSGIRPPATPESEASPRADWHSNADVPAPNPECRAPEEAGPSTLSEKFALTCVMSSAVDNEAVRVVSA
ncbi:MAG: hypothetical protein AAGC80_26135 [Rhodococcus sp. (in: high G+C Gram-positive bacteria)]